MSDEYRMVNQFFKQLDILLDISGTNPDDNKVIDGCMLDGARLWHRLTDRQKKLAFGSIKRNDKQRLNILTSLDKYSLDKWEKWMPGLSHFNTFEEWKTVQKDKE